MDFLFLLIFQVKNIKLIQWSHRCLGDREHIGHISSLRHVMYDNDNLNMIKTDSDNHKFDRTTRFLDLVVQWSLPLGSGRFACKKFGSVF